MKLQDLQKITNAIASMSKDELNLIVDAVNSARRRTSILSSTQFSVGQKVIFGKPRGQKRSGVITKMNPSKALVDVYDSYCDRTSTWRVPYSLLKEVA